MLKLFSSCQVAPKVGKKKNSLQCQTIPTSPSPKNLVRRGIKWWIWGIWKVSSVWCVCLLAWKLPPLSMGVPHLNLSAPEVCKRTDRGLWRVHNLTMIASPSFKETDKHLLTPHHCLTEAISASWQPLCGSHFQSPSIMTEIPSHLLNRLLLASIFSCPTTTVTTI